MNQEEKTQYFSVYNGQYYVKRTAEDFFYILTDCNEWKYNPSLADEFYDVLSGYVEITEEAMQKTIAERNKRHGGGETMDGNFTIKDDDCVFRIVCNTLDEPTETIVYDDGEIQVEITTYEGSCLVHSIECIYAESVEIERYYLRDYTEIEDIKKFPDISINTDADFYICFNLFESYLDIIMNECIEATHYYADGRLEYYYDENMTLLYIKVKDLTEEEYRYFRNL